MPWPSVTPLNPALVPSADTIAYASLYPRSGAVSRCFGGRTGQPAIGLAVGADDDRIWRGRAVRALRHTVRCGGDRRGLCDSCGLRDAVLYYLAHRQILAELHFPPSEGVARFVSRINRVPLACPDPACQPFPCSATAAGDGQPVLLVRIDQIAVGDPIHMNNDVDYLPSVIGAVDMLLHEKREVVAVVRSDRL